MYHDDASNIHDTTIYQLKTYIGQDYIDNQGRTAKEFKRFKRNTNLNQYKLRFFDESENEKPTILLFSNAPKIRPPILFIAIITWCGDISDDCDSQTSLSRAFINSISLIDLIILIVIFIIHFALKIIYSIRSI